MPTPYHLIELAQAALHGGVTLDTDRGWFDRAELFIYRYADQFEAKLTIFEQGRTFTGPTWYDPPETEWRETEYAANFVKIAALEKWAKSHGFDIESAHWNPVCLKL